MTQHSAITALNNNTEAAHYYLRQCNTTTQHPNTSILSNRLPTPTNASAPKAKVSPQSAPLGPPRPSQRSSSNPGRGKSASHQIILHSRFSLRVHLRRLLLQTQFGNSLITARLGEREKKAFTVTSRGAGEVSRIPLTKLKRGQKGRERGDSCSRDSPTRFSSL